MLQLAQFAMLLGVSFSELAQDLDNPSRTKAAGPEEPAAVDVCPCRRVLARFLLDLRENQFWEVEERFQDRAPDHL